jgi:hypothetical protein
MTDTQTDDLAVAPANLAPAVIRTFVPIVVAALVDYLARKGLDIDSGTQLALVNVGSMLVATVYYAAVRELERRFPRAGWLLGSPHAPVYPSAGRAAGPTGYVPGLGDVPVTENDILEGP